MIRTVPPAFSEICEYNYYRLKVEDSIVGVLTRLITIDAAATTAIIL